MNLGHHCPGTDAYEARAQGLPVRREWTIEVPAPAEAPGPYELPPAWLPEPAPERAPEEVPA